MVLIPRKAFSGLHCRCCLDNWYMCVCSVLSHFGPPLGTKAAYSCLNKLYSRRMQLNGENGFVGGGNTLESWSCDTSYLVRIPTGLSGINEVAAHWFGLETGELKGSPAQTNLNNANHHYVLEMHTLKLAVEACDTPINLYFFFFFLKAISSSAHVMYFLLLLQTEIT